MDAAAGVGALVWAPAVGDELVSVPEQARRVVIRPVGRQVVFPLLVSRYRRLQSSKACVSAPRRCVIHISRFSSISASRA